MNSLKQHSKFFMTGIGTDVGKTVVSTIMTAALKADFWKPIQAGDLTNSDTMKVQRGVLECMPTYDGTFHPEAYRLPYPLSPHWSAEQSQTIINTETLTLPQTTNHLIVEGAGGLMVPITRHFLVADLIAQLGIPTFVVSRHYLGSINHTLLTLEALQARKIPVAGLIFNGDENIGTESVICERHPSLRTHRIPQAQTLNTAFFQEQIGRMQEFLDSL
jgi:dethiobiotin synthetase